ncbi:NAD(P)/FAD-dependent oxidoreductase [Jannaschia aquimarina]|uniref:PuuB_1 protein n=1 Tax=Jannaschia aquimarina TaxID=935700 RepID=A0A0D1EBS6_9RHOB|nr:FAD-binding oxidoreductase [Jannaschia aquimarina]KIT15189.1 Gamma-glutamylputrescine oxidoreductase [Jannaschia aquimarina]SNS85587.1 gamma-glutamylputrescine oxidase [Jannaschia aquimarina]
MDLLTANDRDGTYPPSLYAAQARMLPPFAPARGDLRCDVCVVGGGFTGLSTALHLAQRGYDVRLFEAQRVGFGASGRNGGQVGQGQRLDQEDLERMVGLDHAHALWRIGMQAVDLVRELAADDRVAVPFYPGIAHADHRARDVPATHAYVDKLRKEYDYPHVRALNREELREAVASPLYHGGAVDTWSGHLDPLRFALGLARLAQDAGAHLHEGSRVRRIAHGQTVTLTTDKAVITADHLVLACNGYLGDLEPRVARRVMPLNNYILATEPLPDRQEEIIRGNIAVADSKFVVNYFRFSDDHRLLFGGTESYGYRFPHDIAGQVRRAMVQVFPHLKDVQIAHAWGGTLGITMNRMPHYARLSGNVLSMSGFSGHGVALGTLSGQIAAEAIAGQAERFDVMASVPTPLFPGGRLMRQPLLVAAMLWYSLRDRL